MNQTTCTVIPFPPYLRFGHARRVAVQLDAARTNRDADWRLHRAMKAFRDQLTMAGIPADEIRRHSRAYLSAIYDQCLIIRSKWIPELPDRPSQTNGGGDAA